MTARHDQSTVLHRVLCRIYGFLRRFRYLQPNQFVVTVDGAANRIRIDEPRGLSNISKPDFLLLDDVLASGVINRSPARNE